MTISKMVRRLAAGSVLALAMALAAAPAPSSRPTAAPASAPAAANVTAEQALAQLRAGNQRYVAGKSEHPRGDAQRRQETVQNGQHPIATILGCSDSRCGLEILFDQGIGDLFTVRVAGNVCDIDEIASIEYGAEHLSAPLLVVLGHSKCGAVTAVAMSEDVQGNLPALAAKIVPAVRKARAEHPELSDAELVPFAIEANVWQSMDDLFRRSPVVRDLVREGKLKVIGAIQDLESGQVKWLGEPADLPRLLNYGQSQAAAPGQGHPSPPAALGARTETSP